MANHNYKSVLKTNKYQKQLQNVFEKLHGKKVVLYGVGEFFESLIKNNELDKKIDIDGISDIKFESLPNGTKYKSFNAIKPSQLKDYDADAILVTTAFPKKILKSLNETKYKHIKEIFPVIQGLCPLFKYDISFVKEENNKIYYHLNEYNIDIVCDEYYGIVEEVFYWKIYDLQKKFNFADYNFFDIGMNRAYTDLYFALDNRCQKCFGFEPFKATYDFAIENINLNPKIKNKIHPYNFGLSNKDNTQLVYFLPHRDGISSANYDFIKNYAPEELNNITETNVILKKASDIFANLIEKNPSTHKILKLDAEGAEYEVLPDLFSKNLLEHFNVIAGDMHVINSKEETKKLFEYIYKSGFKAYEINEHEKTMDYIFYKNIDVL